MLSKPSAIVFAIIVTLVVVIGGTEGFAESNGPLLIDDPSPEDLVVSETAQLPTVPLVYAHVFGGAGFSYLSASDVESVIGEDFGIGIGLPTWSYGVRSGYRNIFQIEYNFGQSDHDFNNNSIVEDVPDEVIAMDYSTNEIHFKFNPVFWIEGLISDGKPIAFFLVYGFGDVEWIDENDDGFSGTSTVMGLEYTEFTKNVSYSISFKHYGIEFEETTLAGIPFEHSIDASDYILEFKIGIGLGL